MINFLKNKHKPTRGDHGSIRASSSQDQSFAFRRNRTLVGVAADSQSPRSNIHHLATRRRKIFSVFSIIVISIVVMAILILNFTASPVAVIYNKETNVVINQDKYNKAIQDYLDSNPLERLSFILDQSALSGYVSSKLPEVKNVVLGDLSRVGFTNFQVKMRKPVAGWVIGDKQYYVDDMGVSFEKNYFPDPQVQIVDSTGAPIQSGETSVSKRLLGFVGLVVSAAGEYGYIVTKATLPASTMRELDINVKGCSYPVKLSIDRPVGEQIEDMARSVAYFAANDIDPDYIDVRVSNKAYYR